MASIVALMFEVFLVLIIALPMVLGAIVAERKATQFTSCNGVIERHRGGIDWFDYLSRGIVLALMAYAAWFGWPVRLPLVAGFLIVYGAFSFFRSAQEMLKTRALAHEYESLLIVAPPTTLGELRRHYHSEVERRLIGEIPKDLTNHPVDEIEKIIASS